ncbi:MAG: NifU family protein [Ignavibacteriaceae bacterium]|nr:NifU family protein [Ignavibacteriaceae bacterium]
MLQIEDVDLTPNPHALKFILNEPLLKYERRHFGNKNDAANDPLAKGIFEIHGVISVYYTEKFITVEKAKDANWGQIQKVLVKFLGSFEKNLIPAEKNLQPQNESESALLKQINEILDNRVRPALAGDGGGLEVLGIDGYKVTIRYQGACGGCPSSISGTLRAIEGLLRRDVNSAIEVIAA